jgi:Flp pilus assembly protein TadG
MGALKTAQTRWLRCRRSRGAAMLEAAVVMPLFLLLFAGLVFASKLYLAKIRVMNEARVTAWAYATSNCNAWPDLSGTDPAAASQVVASMWNRGSFGNSVNASRINGGDPNSSLGTDQGVAKTSAHMQLNAGGLIRSKKGGPLSVHVSATQSVTCNEPPYDGNLPTMAQEAIHLALEVKDEAAFAQSQVGRAAHALKQFLQK